MADILSQKEIDVLLDVVEEPEDYGSPEFEELYEKYQNDLGSDYRITGLNPEEIMSSLNERKEIFKKVLNDFERFKTYYSKFDKICIEQPEIFI